MSGVYRFLGILFHLLVSFDFISQPLVLSNLSQSTYTLQFVISRINEKLFYNCEEYFFILSFFVGYILSFGLVRLRTIRLSVRAGAHIEYSSRSLAEDVTITNVIIKTPDRK